MKVYALLMRVDYEGEALCGVYSTRELAEAAVEEMVAAHTRKYTNSDRTYTPWDELGIAEVDLDSTPDTYKYSAE